MHAIWNYFGHMVINTPKPLATDTGLISWVFAFKAADKATEV